MIKIFLFLALVSQVLISQNINNAEIFPLECSPSIKNRIVLYQNDSIYILQPGKNDISHAKIILCNIKTGKVLGELVFNEELFGVNFPKENLHFVLFAEDQKISLFIAQKYKQKFIINKKVINKDLTITDKKEQFFINRREQDDMVMFNIKPSKNFYTLSVYDYDLFDRIRNQNTSFYYLSTLKKDLTLIENESYYTSKNIKTLFRKPDQFNNYGILYQINLSGKNNVQGEKILCLPDSIGRIKKFQSEKLQNYDLFMIEKDSAGFIFGYCLTYLNPAEKKVDVKLSKFKLNFEQGIFEILDSYYIYTNMETKHLPTLNCQPIVKNGHFKACIYNLYFNSLNLFTFESNRAVFIDIKNDELITKYYLPISTFGYATHVGYYNLKFVSPHNKSIIYFNDCKENMQHSGSMQDEEIELLNLSRKDSKPVVFSASELGEVEKNTAFNPKDNNSYLQPEGTWVDENGNIYIPYRHNHINGVTSIIKILKQ